MIDPYEESVEAYDGRAAAQARVVGLCLAMAALIAVGALVRWAA
ncbi:hypothetical protein [Salmonella enterica]|nr:hypothetical protein [Salmonella enterica]